ncbi:MAG: hypothetical protein DRN07_01420 [Thermoplasmata archaeon]|nr:MAG: hypothetical protein DRN07_01420 [Thermoplasmata archaeon]
MKMVKDEKNRSASQRLWSVVAVVLILMAGVLLPGCEKKTAGPTEKVAEIKIGTDDGCVSALTHFLPDAAYGFVISGFDRASVGVALSGGGDSLTGRALYRFDISDWNDGTITFHCRCISRTGAPDSIEVYVIDDFGSLPASPGSDPQDVSATWNLLNTGVKVGEISPIAGNWFEISIPNAVVQEKKTGEGYLAIMLKLSNEEIGADNAYDLSTYEYAESRHENKPYLAWNE